MNLYLKVRNECIYSFTVMDVFIYDYSHFM